MSARPLSRSSPLSLNLSSFLSAPFIQRKEEGPWQWAGGGQCWGRPGVRVPATLKESGVCGKMGLVFSVCLLFLGGRGHSLVVFVAENGV